MTRTVRETAEFLKVSEKSIRRRLAEFYAVRIGRAWRITSEGIAAFLAANTARPPKVREIRKRRTVSAPERLRAARDMRERARAL